MRILKKRKPKKQNNFKKKLIVIIAAVLTAQIISLCFISVVYAGESSRSSVAAPDKTAVSAGVKNESWINDKIYYVTNNRSLWLYELMTAAGYSVGADKSDGIAILGLAKSYGIIDSYSREDICSPLTRRFVCSTLVRALGYPKRSVGYLADVKAGEEYMSTAAYFGYFLPDFNDRVYPDKAVSQTEYDKLLAELSRYRLLKGKRALSFGDSIMYGAGNDGEGVSEITAIKYGMTCIDYAVSGATFGECKGRGHIPDQLRKAHDKKRAADVILLDGGTNDVNHTSFGKLTNGYDMSKTSEKEYTGAFEKTLWLLDSYWKGVPVIYIRAHNMMIGDEDKEKKYGERAMEIASKWHINAIDLYSFSGMNTEDAAMRNRYTYINPLTDYTCDSIHPNAIGYAKFYLPPVADILTKLFDKEAQ